MMHLSVSMAQSIKRLAITTGDSDGIGLEITLKALNKIHNSAELFQYVVFVDHKAFATHKLSAYSLNFQFEVINEPLSESPEFRKPNSLLEAAISTSSRQVTFVLCKSSPVAWIYQASLMSQSGLFAGVCTGPLSKTQPGAEHGHSGILKAVTGTKPFMLFCGPELNVALLTDHLPLVQVAKSIAADNLDRLLNLCLEFRALLPSKQDLPIGVLGLNPHCGESGLLGDEEATFLSGYLTKKRNLGLPIEGPLVPDSAFRPEIRSRFSIYVAMYHDQGLIPFKTLHGSSVGVQISLGLPIHRTSVDHGTAKEIFGRQIADAGSMVDALVWLKKITNRLPT